MNSPEKKGDHLLNENCIEEVGPLILKKLISSRKLLNSNQVNKETEEKATKDCNAGCKVALKISVPTKE